MVAEKEQAALVVIGVPLTETTDSDLGYDDGALRLFDHGGVASSHEKRKDNDVADRLENPDLRPPRAQLEAMIEEATVDCYNSESEQAMGIFVNMEEHLALPFMTTILGMAVTVTKVDITQDDQIVAVCARDQHQQTIPILDLPLPSPPPSGAEWIAAYRLWVGGR